MYLLHSEPRNNNNFTMTAEENDLRPIKKTAKADNDPWVPVIDMPNLPGTDDSRPIPILKGFNLPAPQNPHYQLIESEKYIKSLEQKLARLTKNRLRKEPTPRDIISSLAAFHDDQMRRYIEENDPHSSSAPHDDSISLDDNSVQPSYLQRRLFPERQPMNAEEIAELVKEDALAEQLDELSKTDGKEDSLGEQLDELSKTDGVIQHTSADTQCHVSGTTASGANLTNPSDEAFKSNSVTMDVCYKRLETDEAGDNTSGDLAAPAAGSGNTLDDGPVLEISNNEENWANFDDMNTCN